MGMMKKSVAAASPDAYVKALKGWRRRMVEDLRAAVTGAAKLDEVIKWRNLVYISNGPALVIRAEEDRVLLTLFRGQSLRTIEPRLNPGGKYEMATLELREGMSVAPAVVRKLTKEAVALNKRGGDPTKLVRALVLVIFGLAVGCTSSSGAPTVVPTPNTAPAVFIVNADRLGCSPVPNRPCLIPVTANIQDAEGGRMTIRWSGCATGSGVEAQCAVTALGDVKGAVEVTDPAGATTRAEFTAVGRNSAPRFTIVNTHVWPNGGSIEFMALVVDPEAGPLFGSQYCVSAVTTGSCHKPTLRCPSSGPELIVLRTGDPGMCEVTVQTKDDWGAIGTSVISFDIAAPQTMLVFHK